jgi:hypothetical protein
MEYLYSGHETFSLRISWLPKAVGALENKEKVGEDPFSNPRVGMTTLGLGKNMVQSLHFWAVATGLATKTEDGLALTDFAKLVFSRKKKGYDTFLEKNHTLWLIHWNLCQGWKEEETRRRPYAWQFFANELNQDEITATEAIDHFNAATASSGKALSRVTLQQHFDVFTKTYVEGETAGQRTSPEEALDSPLTTLGLIKASGDRKLPSGKRETVYRINNRPKNSLSADTFRLCLHQWWDSSHSNEQFLTVRQVATSIDSPGRCFRLPETVVHKTLEQLAKTYPREFALVESQNQRAVRRKSTSPEIQSLLEAVYSS